VADASAAAAGWISDQLRATRDTRTLSMLCLDVDGSTCCWLSSPSEEPSILNVVARSSSALQSESDTARGSAAIDFYAPSVQDSSIQALSRADATGSTSAQRSSDQRKSKAAEKVRRAAGGPTVASQRLAILAMTDVPARLLVDALDKASIPVESAASLWHAMALAWDPGWTASGEANAAGADPLVSLAATEICATIVIDVGSNLSAPHGGTSGLGGGGGGVCPRLIWCWSRGGQLLVAGSMRLRTASAASSNISADAPAPESAISSAGPVIGEDEAGRLTAEWLGWAAQLSCSPRSVTCLMPSGDPGLVAAFGTTMAKLWPQSSFDAAMHADPVEATLFRAADRLEQTPKAAGVASSGTSLISLASRHGRAHRNLYIWSSLTVAACAVVAGAVALQLRSLTAGAKAQTQSVMSQSAKLVTEYFPDARPGPGYSLLMATNDEVAKLRNLSEPPRRTEPRLPILEELTTVSMVVGNSNYALESLDFEASSTATQKMTIVANSLADAEAMTDALNSIAGSKVERWLEPPTIDTTSRPGKYKVSYTAKLLPLKVEKKAEGL